MAAGCEMVFDPLFLDCISNQFTYILTGGFLRVRPWVLNTMTTLLTVGLVAGLSLYLIIPHPLTVMRAADLILRLAVLWAIVQNWITLTDACLNTLVWLSLQVGASQLTAEEFGSPGRTMLLGIQLSTNLYMTISAWGADWWIAPLLFLFYTLAFMSLWLVFAVLALAQLLTKIEVQLLGVYAFLVWPLMTISFLSWISEGLTRNLVGAMLRYSGLAALFSIILPFVVAISLGDEELTFQSSGMLAIGIFVIGYITWKGPAMLGASPWPGSGLVAMGMLTWIGLRGR